jgi:uncharacterized protein
VKFEWDERKRETNLAKHGVDFLAAEGFEWETARVVLDARRDYGEARRLAYGLIGGRLHAMVFTSRGERVRVISLRKANRREIEAYEQATATEQSE